MDTHSSGYYKQNTHTAATWPDAQFRMENQHSHGHERNCLYGNLVLFQLLRQVRIPGFFYKYNFSFFFLPKSNLLPELGLALYNLIE